MRIIVIGAGVGGLYAARQLALSGHNVEIFEKNPEETLGYDWHDEIESALLSDLGISLPDARYSKATTAWSLAFPFSNKRLTVPKKQDGTYSVERRPFLKALITRAEAAGVSIHFHKKVDCLMIDGLVVRGVIVKGQEHAADIVIDSAGALSLLRASLPKDAGLPAMPRSDEVFYAYRGYFAKRPSSAPVSEPETVERCFINHLSEKCIAWCIDDPACENSYDVMIGKGARFPRHEVDEALEALRKIVPDLSPTLTRGGFVTPIPVRYPASMMVSDGYVIIGDAAFMTAPLFGSGISPSMRAGAILADTINQNKSSSVEMLWEYQARFFREVGARHIPLDLFKRWLLTAPENDLQYILDSELFSEKDFSLNKNGLPSINAADIFSKYMSTLKGRPALLVRLNSLVLKCKNSYKHAIHIPTEYNLEKITAWRKKLDGFFDNA